MITKMKCFSVFVKKHSALEKNVTFFYFSPMPKTLHPMKSWLTPTLPMDWTGVASTDCYTFLPSLVRLKSEKLPIVPTIVHDPHEELEFTSQIIPVESWVSLLYI